MSLRLDFVHAALQEGANVSQLCQQFGISRRVGYKWLQRFQAEGAAGLDDRSRRPHRSPRRTPPDVEQTLLAVRQAHPAWGARKIQAWLQQQGLQTLPSVSTITAILHRHAQIAPAASLQHRPCQHFERAAPNELWQMDFKGYFALPGGGYCHPLTVLDDHSRFLLALRACADQSAPTVQQALTQLFREYGLPERMLMDNGAPWGDAGPRRHTVLTAWLLRLDIRVSHGRPYHPQTQGKDERLHRTLQAELLSRCAFQDLADCQRHFDPWRRLYNEERPHEALDLQPPCTRYQPSSRCFPELLPPVVYDVGALVRKVDATGRISFRNRVLRVGKAFRGQPVALYPGEQDGQWVVYYCRQAIATLDLTSPPA